MFKLLKDSFKVKDIRSKILFTVFVLFAFRLGAHITVPGVDANSLQSLSELPFFNMMNMVSGSAMQNFSIFLDGGFAIYYCINRYSIVTDGHRS
jgi:preprotein translocase subunit SecY